MPNRGGLLGRITRAFWLQVLLITLGALLGVYLAKIVIEENLLKSAVLEEAEFFWERHSENAAFALPDTKNLSGFFDPAKLPAVVQQDLPETPGFYEYEDSGKPLVLYLSRHDGQELYLLYYHGQVDALIVYYGLFPLLTVLTILYLTLFLVYRFAHRSLSPVVRLAQHIDQVDLGRDELSLRFDDDGFGRNDEIQTLAAAIADLGDRLQAAITRERNFTRDASHELRTPLTVINVATDMILIENELPAPAQESLLKIKRAVYDMENLTEVFLMLAREHGNSLTQCEVDVNRVVREQIEQTRFLRETKSIRLHLNDAQPLRVYSSETVIAVLLGNLLRNALLYTDEGDISIDIESGRVVIRDNGPGIPEHQLQEIFEPFKRAGQDEVPGFGIGLTIVKRLCDRFGWRIEVNSEANRGTTFGLLFNPA